MAKCGVCGMDVKQNPCIDSNGKCTLCDAQLAAKSQSKK